MTPDKKWQWFLPRSTLGCGEKEYAVIELANFNRKGGGKSGCQKKRVQELS